MIHRFCVQAGCPDGANPTAGLVLGADGNFYGVSSAGGTNNSGTFFKMTPTGLVKTVYNFCSKIGCTDGAGPSSLMLGSDGNFYGTTFYGGFFESGGTIFKITPTGQLTTLFAFTATGLDPQFTSGHLVQAANGNFYGTSRGGGNFRSSCPLNNINAVYGDVNNVYGCGTFFQLTPKGRLTILHSFCAQATGGDGYGPNGVILASDGNFYGTTGYSIKTATGACADAHGSFCGNAFKITLQGALTTLHTFCEVSSGPCDDGGRIRAPLVQGRDGKFYGTASYGGTYFDGTVFSLDVGLGGS